SGHACAIVSKTPSISRIERFPALIGIRMAAPASHRAGAGGQAVVPCAFKVAFDSARFFAKNRQMFLPARLVRGVWVALLLLVLAPLSGTPAPRAKKFPKCCVWRVTNAKAPFYLVGSIHALSKKDYPLPEPYDIALKDSTRFLFEFDPTQGAEFQKKFEAAAKYPPGQDLRSKISPELMTWLRKNMFTVIPAARGGNGEQFASF